MLIERRAIYQIQTELKKISQICDFKQDWTTLCIQFFSKHEQSIPHIPFSYKEYSLGLLYYIIRQNNSSITQDYFLFSVITRMNINSKNVFKIYRKLCYMFGAPQNQINYLELLEKIIDFLKMKHHYQTDSESFEYWKRYVYSTKYSRIRGLSMLIYRIQKKPKQYLQKQIEYFVGTAFSEIKLL